MHHKVFQYFHDVYYCHWAPQEEPYNVLMWISGGRGLLDWYGTTPNDGSEHVKRGAHFLLRPPTKHTRARRLNEGHFTRGVVVDNRQNLQVARQTKYKTSHSVQTSEDVTSKCCYHHHGVGTRYLNKYQIEYENSPVLKPLSFEWPKKKLLHVTYSINWTQSILCSHIQNRACLKSWRSWLQTTLRIAKIRFLSCSSIEFSWTEKIMVRG